MTDVAGETFLIPPDAIRALGEALRAMQSATGELEQRRGNSAERQIAR